MSYLVANPEDRFSRDEANVWIKDVGLKLIAPYMYIALINRWKPPSIGIGAEDIGMLPGTSTTALRARNSQKKKKKKKNK